MMDPVAVDTAALMVTHDGARFLVQQCESIFRQTVLPDVLLIVDDASTDGTRDLLRELRRSAPLSVEIVGVDGSREPDPASRIAANVVAGLRMLSGHQIVILADQDDEWLPDRVFRQRDLLTTLPRALLVAGDGILIDEAGRPVEGTLQQVFPPPEDWEKLDAAGRMRAVLRRPFVTGATCAFTVELARLIAPVPRGWLHDRWATLVAGARGGLVLQREPVIHYRLHEDQAIGLRMAQKGIGARRWQQVLDRGSSPLRAAGRAVDVVCRLRPIASDPGVRAELSWRAVLASALDVSSPS